MIEIFTDGSTINNGDKMAVGGIAFSIIKNGEPLRVEHYGLLPKKDIKITNQLCELLAILIALEYATVSSMKIVESNSVIKIYTDSMYSINALTKWNNKWIENGWVVNNNKKIKNLWLIYRISQITKKFPCIFQHVKSHQQPPSKTHKDYYIWKGNDSVDKLATEESKKLINHDFKNGNVLNWKAFLVLVSQNLHKYISKYGISNNYNDVVSNEYNNLLKCIVD